MKIDEMITTPCNVLKQLPDEEKWAIAREVALYYQNKGFPYFKLNNEEKEKIVIQLCNLDVSTLELPNDELQQNMLGLNLANSYHPQLWEVHCNTSRSPYEVFWDKELLTKAIYKRIHMSTTKLQPFNIRKSIQVFGGHRASNFKPTVAKYIYERYCPAGGLVLDPCAGYSGRLLGALCSTTVGHYVGIDPDVRQIKGGVEMTDLVLKYITTKEEMDIDLLNLPFEDMSFTPYADLVFTSPPYFDTEKYSKDATQSYIRFPTYDEWRDGFLYTLITNSYCALKMTGYFVINVAGKRLVEDTLEYANHIFRGEPKVKKMRLSKVIGQRSGGCEFKLENLYIYQKT